MHLEYFKKYHLRLNSFEIEKTKDENVTMRKNLIKELIKFNDRSFKLDKILKYTKLLLKNLFR